MNTEINITMNRVGGDDPQDLARAIYYSLAGHGSEITVTISEDVPRPRREVVATYGSAKHFGYE